MSGSTLKIKANNLGLLFKVHLIITVVCTALTLCFFSSQVVVNFVAGELYVWMSLASLSLSVYLFFLKKNIALIVGVIVFKWPILIYVVYRLTESVSLNPVALSLGFFPVLISSIIWSVLQKD